MTKKCKCGHDSKMHYHNPFKIKGCVYTVKGECTCEKFEAEETSEEIAKGIFKKILDKKKQGKRNKAAGARFELKVRKDLEDKGWIVSKWMNNVGFEENPKWFPDKDDDEYWKEQRKLSAKPTCKKCNTFPCLCNIGPRFIGKLIPAKHKFRGPGIPMAIGTGFPDFIMFKLKKTHVYGIYPDVLLSQVVGVEVKSNGYLDKEEKEKCKWLLQNKIFSKILIARKGLRWGTIKYKEVENGS